ncbi:MAG: hypothetical protein Q4G30_01815 [Actinomycetaceae bacterium]|nr:hypothetical protein [Actinomycetaceae bacterium]
MSILGSGFFAVAGIFTLLLEVVIPVVITVTLVVIAIRLGKIENLMRTQTTPNHVFDGPQDPLDSAPAPTPAPATIRASSENAYNPSTT